MKTLEFKIYPSTAQSQTIDLWLDQLKWVWNRGLEIRLEAQQRRWREKYDTWISEFKPVFASEVEGQQEATAVASEDEYSSRDLKSRNLPASLKLKFKHARKNSKLVGCGIRKTKAGHKYCEVRTCRDIENPKKFAQCEFFRSDRIPEWLQDVPSKFKQGVNDALDKAWKAYSDPKHPGRKPKFKNRYDKLKSLLNRNAGGKSKELKPSRIPGSDNGYVHFPKLGKLYVKGLFKRFSVDCDYGVARIVKEPSGYYLQVCVDAPDVALPKSDRPVGIDPGLISVITTDQGREVKPPKLYRKQQVKLRRLQRKLARQQKDSSNSKKTKKLIARLHEKIRRSRNAFNHKLSTKVVREYGAIVVEDIQIKNLIRRPKAKQREDGKGYEQNGVRRKSGLNKSFADSALGDLLSKIETKCKDAAREFFRVPAHYTTINCSQCGSEIKKSLSVRTHRCTCGYIAGRDENAAQNILLKGCELFRQTYRSWEWKRDASLKPVFASEMEGRQEAVQTAPRDEYSLRSPDRAAQAQAQPQTLFDLDTVTLLLNEPLPQTSVGTKKKKRRSSQNISESFIQLTLWD